MAIARWQAGEAGTCVTLFLVLGAAWAVVIPAAEPPDEAFHLIYAAHVAREGRLPVMRPPEIVEVPVEGNQPPLYYLAGALVLRAAGRGDQTPAVPPGNPRSNKKGGTEVTVYDHRDARYAWGELEGSVRTLRLAFLPLGGLVVLLTYLAAVRTYPGSRSVPVLAAGFAATVPQFTFVMASVSNDVLANAVAAAAFVIALTMVTRGRASRRDVAFLGALIGLGLATKMTLLFLFTTAAAIWLTAATVRRRTLDTLIFLVVVGIVASPVLIRYQLEYGEPFGLELNRLMFPQRLHDPGVAYWAGTFLPALFYSFWGVFGHMNVHLGELYGLFAGLTLAGALGLALRMRRGDVSTLQRRAAIVIISALIVLLASIVQYNLNFPQPQGRYLFPAMLVLALLFASGASALLGERYRLAWAGVGLMAITNAAVLVGIVMPAYAR